MGFVAAPEESLCVPDVKERKHVSVRALAGRCGHALHSGGGFGHPVSAPAVL